jgi:hypothetical protein
VPDSRARIWFSLFVLAVFCLGGAGGFLLGRHMPPPRDRFFGRQGPPGVDGEPRGFGRLEGPGLRRGGPPLPPDLVDRLSSTLQLDTAQQGQVQKILDEHREHLEQVHRDARDQFAKEQSELHAAIRAVLRPDQQQKFDKFLER